MSEVTPIRNTALTLPILGCVIGTCLTCACSPQTQAVANQYQSPPVAYAQIGQTVKEVVDSLPPTGGIVLLGAGAWPSGYNSDEFISKPNIQIVGYGRPDFNSDFTAMIGGTIILGQLAASPGANYLTVKHLGVDAGPSYIDANNCGVPTNALAIYNRGQVIGGPQIESPVIDNVACLGYNPIAAVHCMLVENVNHAWVHNVVTVMNQHGFVLKGTNSIVDGVFARGHGIDSVIVKSDDYAPTSQNYLSNITIEPLFSAGDTKGIMIVGVGAPVSDITISNARILGPLVWGIYVQGDSAATSASHLNFSDISIDYPGGSPKNEYCMQFLQYVSNVQINNLKCFDMWGGITSSYPVANKFSNFTVQASYFANVATDAVQTSGSWYIFDDRFESVGGNGIVNVGGVTTVCANTFVGIVGRDMLSVGGTFAFGPPPALEEQNRSARQIQLGEIPGPTSCASQGQFLTSTGRFRAKAAQHHSP